MMYAKLAFTGIRKNLRTYLPYLLACTGMIMMMYIMVFLASSTSIKVVTGESLKEVLFFGCAVLAIFSGIFLFYTNSFLIKNRKIEFGLYNILGMGKREIAKILALETLMIYGASSAAGVGTGILFSKISELVLLRMTANDVGYGFSVPWYVIVITLTVFAGIFLLIMMNTLRQIHFSNPIELLRSRNTGEKQPRSHYFLALIGMIMLAVAYEMALTIKNPLKAIGVFFIAVLLVIIATYLLFIAGSVIICRILQRNKRYYYKTNHFLSVSQMAYRMRRNGAGLSSICILSTMVLVTFSSTACLYIGIEKTLKDLYPRNYIIDFRAADDGTADELIESINGILYEEGVVPKNAYILRDCLSITGLLQGDNMEIDPTYHNEMSAEFDDLVTLFISTGDEYNRIMNKNIALGENEAIIFTEQDYPYETITINRFGTFSVKERAESFERVGVDERTVVPAVYLFVDGRKRVNALYRFQKELFGYSSADIHSYYCFDSDKGYDETIRQKIYRLLGDDSLPLHSNNIRASIEVDHFARQTYYELFGGLFFLGIMLGSVFLCAAVLIMYYKQISEGYEDKSKFDILQQVGMTKDEIRRSVNSQVLTVFFLPLAAAGVHTAFAFPLISKLLTLFGMSNMELFGIVCLCCYGAFAAMYVAVYLLTSRSYYRIVSTGKKQ